MKRHFRRSHVIVCIVVGGLAILLAGLWAFTWTWHRINTVPVPYQSLSHEARFNEFLAIEALSPNYNVEIKTKNPFEESSLVFSDDNFDYETLIELKVVPELTDTVIISEIRSSVNELWLSETIQRWVIEGGTLLVQVDNLLDLEVMQDYYDRELFPSNLQVFGVSDEFGGLLDLMSLGQDELAPDALDEFERNVQQMRDQLDEADQTELDELFDEGNSEGERAAAQQEDDTEPFTDFRSVPYSIREFLRTYDSWNHDIRGPFRFDYDRCGRRPAETVIFPSGYELSHLIPPSQNEFDISQSDHLEEIKPLSHTNILQLQYGAGTVYFINDLRIWHNMRADCADHAAIFFSLITGAEELMSSDGVPRTVWLMPPNYHSIISIVWSNFYPSIIGFLIAFVIGNVAWAMRVKPPVFAVSVPRRHALDYVSSPAFFAKRKRSLDDHFQALHKLAENPDIVFHLERTKTLYQSDPRSRSQASEEHTEVFNSANDADLIHKVKTLQGRLMEKLRPTLTTTQQGTNSQ